MTLRRAVSFSPTFIKFGQSVTSPRKQIDQASPSLICLSSFLKFLSGKGKLGTRLVILHIHHHQLGHSKLICSFSGPTDLFLGAFEKTFQKFG